MNNTAPIGFFDSGVGGTSIWHAVHKELPYENTCLLADSANAPYGEKTITDIQTLCRRNSEFLIEQGCKIIVIACNTASVNAAAHLRKHYDLPFIAIEPAIKPAAIASKTGIIGILATKRTLSSQHFQQSVREHVENRGVRLIARHGSGIVELIETGKQDSAEMTTLLKTHCHAFQSEGIDQLVLGCTHYPYLIEQIASHLPHVNIIDNGSAIARHTHQVLKQNNLLNAQKIQPKHQWHCSGNPELLHFFTRQEENIIIAGQLRHNINF